MDIYKQTWWSCSEYQRYKLLKAIHNKDGTGSLKLSVVQNIKDTNFWKQFTTGYQLIRQNSQLFRISKIQTFESNSQLHFFFREKGSGCSEYQRYKLLKAIHNGIVLLANTPGVVQNIKDTNFWKQFTTFTVKTSEKCKLFRISKIQTFESNSQLKSYIENYETSCSEYQRYKLLKAIHNNFL